MRVNVRTESSGHQGVAPVDMCSVYLSSELLEISTGQLQDGEANAVEAGWIRPHMGGEWKVGTTPLSDQLGGNLSALRREESCDLLNGSCGEWCHDTLCNRAFCSKGIDARAVRCTRMLDRVLRDQFCVQNRVRRYSL